MQISLGTRSKQKIIILKSTLESLGIEHSISTFNVDSGISPQPLSEGTTTLGAVNRAKQAISLDSAAKLGVGLEAGLSKIQNIYHLVCVCASIDRFGYISIGVSGKVALPTDVSLRVEAGDDFGYQIREFKNSIHGNSMLSGWADRLIDRDKDFSDAIINCFTSMNNFFKID